MNMKTDLPEIESPIRLQKVPSNEVKHEVKHEVDLGDGLSEVQLSQFSSKSKEGMVEEVFS